MNICLYVFFLIGQNEKQEFTGNTESEKTVHSVHLCRFILSVCWLGDFCLSLFRALNHFPSFFFNLFQWDLQKRKENCVFLCECVYYISIVCFACVSVCLRECVCVCNQPKLKEKKMHSTTDAGHVARRKYGKKIHVDPSHFFICFGSKIFSFFHTKH